MGRIKQLDAATANQIAAGEVIERPASVIKELVENAIDAGATQIDIDIESGGIGLIRVTDNGSGMGKSDAMMSIICHATSKLSQLEDLFELRTMGFRGEALSSIASSSRLTIKTKQSGDTSGTLVACEAGKIVQDGPVGCREGTTVEVRDLFFNFPARYKFLKKDATEAQHIASICQRFAMVRPDIGFTLKHEGKALLQTPGNGDLLSVIYSVYGKRIADGCVPIIYQTDELTLSGYAGRPSIARGNRAEQTLFINDRIIRSKTLSAAIDRAYQGLLVKGRYAFCVICLDVSPHLLDVNVHPQKSEVRFWNSSEVYRAAYHGLKQALSHDLTYLDTVSEADQEMTLDQKSFYQTSSDTIPFSFAEKSFDEKGDVDSRIHEPRQITFELDDFVKTDQTARYEARLLKDARIIGVAFQTYIILEHGEQILLLDQHAAHEKILFEQLMDRFEKQNENKIISQLLAQPVMISLSATERALLSDVNASIDKLGFSYDDFGQNEIALREVPLTQMDTDPEKLFRLTLDTLSDHEIINDATLRHRLASMACKAAIKAHDKLDLLEIKALLNDLSQSVDPFHCPHGRPIAIVMSKRELEKRFFRSL